jgi:type IV pilus assembly protein PilO
MTKMRQWSLMTVIAVVVVFAGGWFLLVKPKQSEISSVKAKATSQQQANQVLLQQIVARQSQQKQLPHEQAQLQKLATQVPTVPDEPGIIRNLTSSATGAGVNLLSLTPGGVTTITSTATTGTATLPSSGAGQLVELPLTISVVGSYSNLESYFQLLEKLPRALLVTQFSLCPISSDSSGSGGSGCSAPTVPGATPPPDGSIGATITASVFFSSATSTAVTGTTTLPSTTTPAATATTPATPPASPAATTPAAPPATAPAN